MRYLMNFRFKDQNVQNEIERVLDGIEMPIAGTFLVKSQDTQNAEAFFRFHRDAIGRVVCTTQPVWAKPNPNHPNSWSFFFIAQYDTYNSRTLGTSCVRQLYGTFIDDEQTPTVATHNHTANSNLTPVDMNCASMPLSNSIDTPLRERISNLLDELASGYTTTGDADLDRTCEEIRYNRFMSEHQQTIDEMRRELRDYVTQRLGLTI